MQRKKKETMNIIHYSSLIDLLIIESCQLQVFTPSDRWPGWKVSTDIQKNSWPHNLTFTSTLTFHSVNICTQHKSVEMKATNLRNKFPQVADNWFLGHWECFCLKEYSIYKFSPLDMTDLPFGQHPLVKNRNNFFQTCHLLNHRV